MKKILSMLLVLSMLLTASAALAEGMGVQVIGGPETETEPVSLDDIKLNASAEIEGYATITPTSFAFVDLLGTYRAGKTAPRYSNGYDSESEWYKSGAEAEYAVLKIDFLNTAMTPKDFLSQYEVKVVFDDKYEYAGWGYQYNYNNSTEKHSNFGQSSGCQNTEWVINKADNFAIDPMYEGHYCFGCTLPNAVVNSKLPLRIVITIDGNEITYNIRK